MAENLPQAFKRYRLVCSIPSKKARACRVQFSPDGRLLAISTDRHFCCTFLAPLTQSILLPFLQKTYIGHEDAVTDLSFSSDSRFLATSSNDHTVRLWDVDSGSQVRTFTTMLEVLVLCVKFNPESNLIASGSSDESVRIWDVGSGACLKVLRAHSGNFITTLDFSPDGSMIVAGSFGGLCRIWDTATGNEIITIKKPGLPLVGSVKFSSDGKFVLVGLMDSTLMIWSMDKGGMLPHIYNGHLNMTCAISSTFIKTDENYIVSGSEDHCLCIWEVQSGRLVGKIPAHAAPVQSVSCHPTYNMIASASLRDINTFKIWMLRR